jgi:DNA-binding NtrC family response regulator
MKLLRALQSRTIQRLGARHDTPFDARMLAATHVDLAAAVSRGRFREDLYYRLNVYEIRVPPLRRRGAGDVRELTAAILERLASRRRRPVPLIDPDVVEWLIAQRWPGNVRELENVLERMIVAAEEEPVLRVHHVPTGGRGAAPPLQARGGVTPTAEDVVEALRRNQVSAVRAATDLGLSRHQLYRLRQRYGLHRKSGDR